ncbi:AraC-like DNA-binding protein [Caulobacter ginsengisoli]|uniref:AraC-like DNA-binding protein n=1 Tax=Caulobacter ginsengisoli TaxID=400775 RepID=A0ABU0IYT3_9CAUL|nr:AraC family transcriptional regulator [Caulobacter ginsengisoli]MDQ0466127.1 AraC-like DNA-binding protein [Caulobacter ginsengisoli]
MPSFTIAGGLAKGLFDFAVARGANPGSLSQRTGLDPRDLEDPDHRVPAERFVALIRAGQDLTGDPALVLHFGEAVNLAQMSVVGLLVQASPTLAEGIAQVRRYGALVNDAGQDRYSLVTRDDGVWMVDHRPNPNLVPELTELAMALLICGSRSYLDPSFVQELHVTHKAPSYAAEYSRAFQTRVVFEADWNAGRFKDGALAWPIAAHPRYVFGVLSEHAEARLKALQTAHTMRGRVEAQLAPGLHTGPASMARVAAALGASRQTLFRRLRDEGVTFEQVLDELRHRLALDYLGSQRISVEEAAYLTGFSDATAFARAFKRWTGVTPKAFRSREN